MIEVNSLSESIYIRLQGVIRLPHQASTIAYDLFILLYKLEQPANFRDQDLVSVFRNKLTSCGLDDLLVRQVMYAIRIADSGGELLYEEMHKLFSLCDEIQALDYLGFELDGSLRIQYEKSIRLRFEREKTKAKMVAEDTVEKWKEEFWWYKNNLST